MKWKWLYCFLTECAVKDFFFFFLRGLRGIKLLPASTLSPFISSLTQEQRWQQYFWADIKIKGAFLTLQPRQKSIFYSQVKLHSPSYVPQPEQQQRWPVHWESWEAGDHPYLDEPVCDQLGSWDGPRCADEYKLGLWPSGKAPLSVKWR